MSFGGGGFGGFGQNNNNTNNQPSSFGGFGANNTNTNTGFGASNNSGFGSNTGGGMFGNTANTASTGGGFGSSAGGFGANTGGGFGAKPAFGASPSTTGGGMFGGANTNTASSGFGGFGASNTNASSPFGGGTTNTSASGGLFGGSKPGFGASASNTGSSLFGGGGNTSTTGGFGSPGGGFGAANNTGMGGGGDPPGTAVAPFQAYTEKEPNSTTSNAFQSLLFQEPYKKWSAEELRLVDYTQGRRHGNAGGGAGAFGVSSGFGGGFGANNQQQQQQTTGGFGSTANNAGGGLFGASNNASGSTGTGFGQTGTTGFGANTNNTTGGGLFGQNKPAGGGLFGGGSNTQTQQTGGGMFGSGNTGFGANNNPTSTTSGFGASTTNTGGGLFGGANNQNKPAGTGFGFGTTNNTSTTSGFGGATNPGFGTGTNTGTGGGLFANTNNNQQSTGGGGLFGNQQQQQQPQQQSTASGFGGFGQQNTQNQTQQTGGGLFGNQAAKPATGGGLFGSSTTTSNTGGGLFGGANNTQQNTSGFGGTANAGGGLFGGAKPATNTGLFGTSTNTQPGSTGGGLFGGLGSNNQQQQQQQGTGAGLFGGANNNQQKPGGLFGGSTQSSGTGMFGSQTQQNQGSSLFGGGSQQNQQGGGLGGSLLGNSQQNANMPQGLTANLNDVSAYGTPALFAGLGGNEAPNPGPLATPLNGNSKPRKSSILPMYKLAPASASRFATPQKRGFGFSYSSYGTPGGSPASISSTPGGLGRSLLGSSGSLSKSMSTNNLRRQFNTEDSILAPGAFSSSSNTRWYGSTGSKKLVINREIRSDLFTTPQKDKPDGEAGTGRKLNKRVSFDTSNVDSEETTTPVRALPAPEDSPSTQAEDTPRQHKSVSSNGSKTPEAEPNGKELAIVQEEDNSQAPGTYPATGFENAPGQYWMKPEKDELQNMNRIQRQKIDGFTVGRENVGFIRFKVPVDISNIDLEDICGGIIQLEPRSATVYPIAAKKPPVGKGLNVPSRISLEQSWPRGGRDKRVTSDPKRFNKHIERLKRITDTTFESYDKDSGVWTFSVEHFTTYGLDDSDDETDADMDTNVASEVMEDDGMGLDEEAEMLAEDDTFNLQRRAGLPGAFDAQDELLAPQHKSFLGVSSADSAPTDVRLSLEDQQTEEMGDEYDLSEDEDMTRSLVGQHHAAELEQASSEDGQDIKRETPGGILRARMRAVKDSAGPVRLEVADGDDWAEMLRKTVSPIKRDRQLLRELNESPSKKTGSEVALAQEENFGKASAWGRRSIARPGKEDGFGASTAGLDKSRGFATSIDLMNSLFEKPKPTRENLRASQPAKGFPKWPYDRQDKALNVDESDRAFHNAPRATWGPDETLVVTRPLDFVQARPMSRGFADILTFQRSGIQTNGQDLRLAKFSTQSSKKYLRSQDKLTNIRMVDGMPFAAVRSTPLKELFHHQDMTDASSIHEKRVWELASILFDDVKVAGSKASEQGTRKKLLSEFWADLVDQASSTAIGLAGSSEEKAVACLAGHRITDACKHLLDGKNFRIGTLVSLIGTSDDAKKDMKEQLKAWQDSKMLSEFTEAIRTIYEMLSGNVCVCEGMKGVPVEDRLESFVISKKFGFDWRQSFGLRLWYALDTQDDVKAAVQKFQSDIDQDREDAPVPWYVEQGLTPLWNDSSSTHRQDLLWGLLQLYADPSADLEAILRPENSQLSPVDVRVCWQLGQALVSTGRVSYGHNEAVKMDAVTVAYAAQLTSAGDWLEAIFVLLHLRDQSARKQAIQEQICRHAGLIGPDNGENFTILVEKLLIPAGWLWEALALYMRSVKKDASAEVQCLLRARSFEEAHRVLIKQVAPQMVIERNYAGLSSLIFQFQGHQDTMSQWTTGGEIYSHFLSLVQHRSKNESIPSALLERLLAGLNAMSESSSDQEIVRYAAVADMADETAREILKMAQKKQDMELRSRILHLPLTQDRLLAYSLDLGLDRYREVMTH